MQRPEKVNGYELPQRKLLDLFSRTDELLVELIRRLGGKPTTTVTVQAPTVPSSELEQLRSGALRNYRVIDLDLSSARTDVDVGFTAVAMSLLAWTDGSLDGIYVRLNHSQSDPIYLKKVNPICAQTFVRIFLTHTAQAGRILTLVASANPQPMSEIAAAGYLLTKGLFKSIVSDKDTHFTGAIAQNATEEENLTGLTSNKIKLRAMIMQSDQQLDYRVALFSKDTFADTDLDLDTIIAEQEIDLPSYGWRIAGAGQYYMVVNGLSIDYEDQDGTKELHVALQNLSSTAKNAGATGEVVIKFIYEEAE